MTTTAAAGMFGFAMQNAKVGDGAFNPASHSWYRFKASDINFGVMKDVGAYPPEVGGIPVLTGMYVRGLFPAGGATILPRCEGDFGWFLKGLMGSASSVNGQPESGLRTHIFRFNPASSYDTPWMAVRKLIPGVNPEDAFGELGYDCKAVSLRLALGAGAPVTARMDFVGRVPQIDENPSWSWADAFEEYPSIPLAIWGGLRIPSIDFGQNQSCVGVTVDIVNGFTAPAEELILGSLYPDDYAIRTRAMMIRWTLKWSNPDMYQRLLGGAPGSEVISPEVFTTSKGAEGYAAEITARSPANIPGKNNPYSLAVRAGRVAWQAEGSPTLGAGDVIFQNFVGTAIEPASDEDWAQLVLVNEQASY